MQPIILSSPQRPLSLDPLRRAVLWRPRVSRDPRGACPWGRGRWFPRGPEERVGGGGRRWGSVPTSSCSLLPDCDLHCKPARGSYRISLKKFCRKDYGRLRSGLPPSGFLPDPRPFSPCPPYSPSGGPDPRWTLRPFPRSLSSSALAGPALPAPGASRCSRCGMSSLCSSSAPPTRTRTHTRTPAGAL